MDFFVLPDSTEAAPLAETVMRRGRPRTLPHASGRPWIVGEWSDGEALHVRVGSRRFAVLGSTGLTEADLARRTAGLHDPAELDGLARSLPGSFHLLASFDGFVQARGSASAVHSLFHTRWRGGTVVASSPRDLAELTGAPVDGAMLSVRLLTVVPFPLTDRPLWRGIDRVPPGHRVDLRPDGTLRATAWWSAPAPEVPLADGAARVRRALADAVAVRTGNARPAVSTDLSGGMDSSALAFLAARGDLSGRLVTTRYEGIDPAHGDSVWGAEAAAAIPEAEHLVIPRNEAPAQLSPLDHADIPLDRPFAWHRSALSERHKFRQVAARGSAVHLGGYGGDELFWNHPLYLRTLLRRRPLTGLRAVRATRSMARWGLAPTVRGLADRRSYARWLEDFTAGVSRPQGPSLPVDLGWGQRGVMSPWATPDAVAAVHDALREAAAARPGPLSPVPGQHESLRAVRETAAESVQMGRYLRPTGTALHTPFLDDRVVEAALSVRIEDRALPGSYKPVLAAAMRGVVPDRILGRPTKAEFSADVYHGLRENRAHLVSLCDDLHLARAGLVDAERLRASLLGLHTGPRTLGGLITVLGCEVWLRAVGARTTATVT